MKTTFFGGIFNYKKICEGFLEMLYSFLISLLPPAFVFLFCLSSSF